jgi:hypothetical protein
MASKTVWNLKKRITLRAWSSVDRCFAGVLRLDPAMTLCDLMDEQAQRDVVDEVMLQIGRQDSENALMRAVTHAIQQEGEI